MSNNDKGKSKSKHKGGTIRDLSGGIYNKSFGKVYYFVENNVIKEAAFGADDEFVVIHMDEKRTDLLDPTEFVNYLISKPGGNLFERKRKGAITRIPGSTSSAFLKNVTPANPNVIQKLQADINEANKRKPSKGTGTGEGDEISEPDAKIQFEEVDEEEEDKGEETKTDPPPMDIESEETETVEASEAPEPKDNQTDNKVANEAATATNDATDAEFPETAKENTDQTKSDMNKKMEDTKENSRDGPQALSPEEQAKALREEIDTKTKELKALAGEMEKETDETKRIEIETDMEMEKEALDQAKHQEKEALDEDQTKDEAKRLAGGQLDGEVVLPGMETDTSHTIPDHAHNTGQTNNESNGALIHVEDATLDQVDNGKVALGADQSGQDKPPIQQSKGTNKSTSANAMMDVEAKVAATPSPPVKPQTPEPQAPEPMDAVQNLTATEEAILHGTRMKQLKGEIRKGATDLQKQRAEDKKTAEENKKRLETFDRENKEKILDILEKEAEEKKQIKQNFNKEIGQVARHRRMVKEADKARDAKLQKIKEDQFKRNQEVFKEEKRLQDEAAQAEFRAVLALQEQARIEKNVERLQKASAFMDQELTKSGILPHVRATLDVDELEDEGADQLTAAQQRDIALYRRFQGSSNFEKDRLLQVADTHDAIIQTGEQGGLGTDAIIQRLSETKTEQALQARARRQLGTTDLQRLEPPTVDEQVSSIFGSAVAEGADDTAFPIFVPSSALGELHTVGLQAVESFTVDEQNDLLDELRPWWNEFTGLRVNQAMYDMERMPTRMNKSDHSMARAASRIDPGITQSASDFMYFMYWVVRDKLRNAANGKVSWDRLFRYSAAMGYNELTAAQINWIVTGNPNGNTDGIDFAGLNIDVDEFHVDKLNTTFKVATHALVATPEPSTPPPGKNVSPSAPAGGTPIEYRIINGQLQRYERGTPTFGERMQNTLAGIPNKVSNIPDPAFSTRGGEQVPEVRVVTIRNPKFDPTKPPGKDNPEFITEQVPDIGAGSGDIARKIDQVESDRLLAGQPFRMYPPIHPQACDRYFGSKNYMRLSMDPPNYLKTHSQQGWTVDNVKEMFNWNHLTITLYGPMLYAFVTDKAMQRKVPMFDLSTPDMVIREYMELNELITELKDFQKDSAARAQRVADGGTREPLEKHLDDFFRGEREDDKNRLDNANVAIISLPDNPPGPAGGDDRPGTGGDDDDTDTDDDDDPNKPKTSLTTAPMHWTDTRSKNNKWMNTGIEPKNLQLDAETVNFGVRRLTKSQKRLAYNTDSRAFKKSRHNDVVNMDHRSKMFRMFNGR